MFHTGISVKTLTFTNYHAVANVTGPSVCHPIAKLNTQGVQYSLATRNLQIEFSN